jgi:hypothetical protein
MNHESPPTLTRGAWVPNGRVMVWQPAPEPDRTRRCRVCGVPVGRRRQLCDTHRDQARAETYRRHNLSRR